MGMKERNKEREEKWVEKKKGQRWAEQERKELRQEMVWKR